ncbi:N-acyl amino acid synthase FeeM domain-containing protein [Aquihabitans daechungensis]|uniref:N-acyl amino acid synthase FeeM domain-containing protein n=1 Tax=Aquihabitans daechungensis TaxID=1052257 RepID=UPI003B9E6570
MDDEVVIDLTDAAMERRAAAEGDDLLSVAPDGEFVVDLTDGAMAAAQQAEAARAAKAVSARVVSGRPQPLQADHQMSTITGGDTWMEAEAFVYERYVSLGYADHSSRRRVEELARWADNSRFHAVVADDGEFIGTVRTIFGPYQDLPVGQFDRTNFDDPNPLCELSSLVVKKEFGGSGVLDHLFRAGWADGLRQGARGIVALIDTWIFDVLCDLYCMPFSQLGEPHFHMGGDVVPVVMSTSQTAMAQIAHHNPEFYRWTMEALTVGEIQRYGFNNLSGIDLIADRAEREHADQEQARS